MYLREVSGKTKLLSSQQEACYTLSATSAGWLSVMIKESGIPEFSN